MQHDRYNVVRTFVDMGFEPDSANGEPHGLGREPGDGSTGYMHRGAVDAEVAYARHFVEEMEERLGPELLSGILAVQLDNEATYDEQEAPIATMAGTVVGLDGRVYDMSDPASRQQAADASMVTYANEAVDAVHSVDPRMMVTMGLFFTLTQSGGPINRMPAPIVRPDPCRR